MATELVKAPAASVRVTCNAASLPVLVERAGGAARFAWDEFFYAEHHNPHTQKAYQRAVRRFLGWAEGQGVELAAITPGMVGQYLVGLGGSPAKRNQHLAALRGFLDRLVNRHVCVLNPASSVRGVKDQVFDLEADLRAGQAAAERCRAAVTTVAAFVPGDRDYRPARPGHPAGGRAILGWARGATDDLPSRPAAEEGDAQHRRADFDLIDAA